MQKNYLLIITILLILSACGGNSSSKKSSVTEIEELDQNISFQESNKTVTIYVHGYQKAGYPRENDYGRDWDNTLFRNLEKFTNLPAKLLPDIARLDKKNFTPFLTSVDYYGAIPPSYYNQDDIDEVDAISEEYDEGIPRYALIVAKFIKHIIKETGADRVNIVSVSMGSFVTRWMIEKNLEDLASDKRIEKWISVEGVIRGNYALSEFGDNLFLNLFFTGSPETEQMKYSWIKENLTSNPEKMESPYYKDILVGEISLTDGTQSTSILKYLLVNDFKPNDGIQIFRDTYFESTDTAMQLPSHTILHGDHVQIKENSSSFANIATFLEAKKRVKITLLDATVTDIHESISFSNKGSEIIFESSIASQKAKERWEIKDSIDQRVYESGILGLYNYDEAGKTYKLNQTIFNGFVLKDEDKLEITIEGLELDKASIYDISETNKVSSKESLGRATIRVELQNATYPISAEDWSGHIKVELIEMQK